MSLSGYGNVFCLFSVNQCFILSHVFMAQNKIMLHAMWFRDICNVSITQVLFLLSLLDLTISSSYFMRVVYTYSLMLR